MKIILTTLSIILIFLPCNVYASEPLLDQRDSLALELFQMTQSVDELIQLLKNRESNNNEFQKLQAAISYLSFRSRNIETLQYELRFKKERKDATEKNIELLKEQLDVLERNNPVFQSDPQSVTTAENKKISNRLAYLQKNFENLDSEIIKLENEIQASKEELSSFESYVQNRLKLIQ